MVSTASWRCCWVSRSCSARSQRITNSLQPIISYLQGTFSYRHSRWCFGRSRRGMRIPHPSFGRGTFTIGHSSRCSVVLSLYSPASWQWGHGYWRRGHSSSMCLSKSLRSSVCTFLPLRHILGHGRRVKPQLSRCSSWWRSSPTYSQPLDLLSHRVVSERICLWPVVFKVG